MNKILDYNVTGQNIELSSAAMLVAGTVNEYTARFAFGADWDGYQRVAVFNADGTEREKLLTDDACKVPWEVLLPGAYLKVGVYGTKDGSRLPTIWTSHRQYIHDGAGPTEEAADPSPVLAEQILQRMGDLGALKTEDKSSLVAAINEIWMSGGGGASVTDAAIDESGHLIITLSTGKTIDAGYAVGPAGSDGQDGADGKSAYQYAKDGGYTGTEAEFAAKLAEEINTSYISEKIEAKVPFMKYGRKLESNTDLNSLVPASADDGISGTYYSPNSATTASLLNCPFTGGGFTMDVSYSTGNDYKYIRQEIKSYSAGDWVRSYSNGTWTDWRKTVKTGSKEWNSLVRVETVKRHPSLTAAQKSAIKALIKDYVDNSSAFYYYGDHNRNALADGSTYDSESGKWGLNCETFVQNILMGRSVNDYVGKTTDTYVNTITKTDVSDFGHYFKFENREIAHGLIKNSDATDPAEYYYGYVKPLADSFKYSYSRNSYWSQYAEDAGKVGGQHLNSFMLAGDMAFELYQKGCEISLAELEVGDILFNKHQGDDATESETFFHKMAWRNIAHVFLVYDISSDGKITLAECTSGYSAPILSRPQDSRYNDDRTRFAYLMHNTVFCARLPAAWTGAGNVPDAITAI